MTSIFKYSIILLTIVSCSVKKKSTTDCWSELTELKLKRAKSSFKKRIKIDSSDKLNYLGLSYIQCALNNSQWSETLNKFTSDPDSSFSFGNMAVVFSLYVQGEKLSDFNIDEFKAFHLGGKFRVTKNHQIIEGEYKDMKPSGIWKYYNLKHKLIEQKDYNQEK